MKIMIVGSTGMLGNAVGSYFLNNCFDVTLTYRKENLKYGKNNIKFDILYDDIENLFSEPHDYYINCAGSIKQKIIKENKEDILINAIFPWKLSEMCEKFGSRLIHITTDCVFSGQNGKYIEEDIHDCLDFYGRTKSLGEPTNAMVLRTSIIGEELEGSSSLIEWAKSNSRQKVRGFTNHMWNGITTSQYAKICRTIIEDDSYQKNKFHIFSPGDVSKYSLLKMINNKFNLDLDIQPFRAQTSVDRTLRSNKSLVEKLKIDPIDIQLRDF